MGGQTGSVFYDIDVPDFRKEKLMLGGLLMTTPSVQQTPSIQPDPVVSKLLPAPATSRREFPQSDVLALYTEIYDNDTSRQARHIDVTVRLVSEKGTDVLVSRDELEQRYVGRKALGHLRIRQTDSSEGARARPLCAPRRSGRAWAG